jgi:NAD-dependent SIR2 family protein deacetylase
MSATKQDIDYDWIAKALKDGTVVPFLGAGVSAGCGLPSGRKLAKILVQEGKFPDQEGQDNLAFVASYLSQISRDANVLKTLLREHFSIEAKPGALHECLASIKALELIVTTNYDDLIERAFARRFPWIIVDRYEAPGNLWLGLGDRAWEEVNAATLTKALANIEKRLQKEKSIDITDKGWGSRPIIFKMHGSLNRADRRHDGFLITEEHYVNFLGRPQYIPSMLERKMRRQNFLFLGYGLRDWNVRVMLRKLALMQLEAADPVVSWAIVREASASEKDLWRAHNVRMYDVELDEFARQLQDRL